MVFLFVCYQSHQSEPEEDQLAAVSESDEQVVNSDQPESTVDDNQKKIIRSHQQMVVRKDLGPK